MPIRRRPGSRSEELVLYDPKIVQGHVVKLGTDVNVPEGPNIWGGCAELLIDLYCPGRGRGDGGI